MKKTKIKKRKIVWGPNNSKNVKKENKQNNIEEKEIEIIKIEDISNRNRRKKYLTKRGRKKEKKNNNDGDPANNWNNFTVNINQVNYISHYETEDNNQMVENSNFVDKKKCLFSSCKKKL